MASLKKFCADALTKTSEKINEQNSFTEANFILVIFVCDIKHPGNIKITKSLKQNDSQKARLTINATNTPEKANNKPVLNQAVSIVLRNWLTSVDLFMIIKCPALLII